MTGDKLQQRLNIKLTYINNLKHNPTKKHAQIIKINDKNQELNKKRSQKNIIKGTLSENNQSRGRIAEELVKMSFDLNYEVKKADGDLSFEA